MLRFLSPQPPSLREGGADSRFTNQQVLEQPDAVLELIRAAFHVSPLGVRGGGRICSTSPSTGITLPFSGTC